jgi:hypothetical protein
VRVLSSSVLGGAERARVEPVALVIADRHGIGPLRRFRVVNAFSKRFSFLFRKPGVKSQQNQFFKKSGAPEETKERTFHGGLFASETL